MSKPIFRLPRLPALAAPLLLFGVLLTPMAPAGTPAPRPPLVAPVGAMPHKLECRLGAARAAR
ncbi:hypothetical protein RAS12_30720 (plasmid) [Achromobacter seleniivolatilans]|uniref:Uncharacterized protein n=1 Tax=Achromobacter seleniivolatilans TaxID=3047478 RepID=A0ABY9MAK3_9BURK|nr:hypothetical protein [Achromobacter sp. R39]WMD24008.1 hypothetical protein RAS12_30720 [Achromobacter sp. R39]